MRRTSRFLGVGLITLLAVSSAILTSGQRASGTDPLYQWHPGYSLPVVFIDKVAPYQDAAVLSIFLVNPKGDQYLDGNWCPGKAIIVVENAAIDANIAVELLLSHRHPGWTVNGFGWASGVIERVEMRNDLTIVFVKASDGVVQTLSPTEVGRQQIEEESTACAATYGRSLDLDQILPELHGLTVPAHPTPKPTPFRPHKVFTTRDQYADPIPPSDLGENDFENRVNPVYPQTAIDDWIEGQVTVKIRLDKDGSIISAWVSQSSHNAELDASALSAARASTYKPGHAGWYHIVYTFSLRG